MAKKTKTNENETRVLCPNCGAEFAIPEQSTVVVGIAIGSDSNLGVIHPPLKDDNTPATALPKTAKERIEALRAAGVDVSNLFAMQGANGGECIACNKDGNLTILEDSDPIFQYIIDKGTVPNRNLFRRWVMSQMFHMLAARDYRTGELVGVTQKIHDLGYEYQWKMLLNELYAQMKMIENDPSNFRARNRWFNKSVVVAMAKDYICEMEKHIASLPVKKCKGIPYKKIAGKNVFVSDILNKVISPFHLALKRIETAGSISELHCAVKMFNTLRIKLPWYTKQCPEWVDAYKGSGAFFTLQNMIRFHGCHIVNDDRKVLTKPGSLLFIENKAKMYCHGEGWKMLGVLKKCIADNNINVRWKIDEWRNR